MIRKRLGKVVLLSVLVMNLVCPAALAARFVDTSGYWAEKYVNKLSDKGIIAAASDGKFKPQDPITRGELAQWMVKVLGLGNQPVSQSPSFPDVKPNDPYYKAVEIMRQNNYISGYADGYRPKQFMQRGEMISIVSRAINAARLDDEAVTQELNRFSDQSKIPQWARQGIALASKEGVLVLETPDKVNSTALAGRGETAAMLSSLSDYQTERTVSEKMHRADMGEAEPPEPSQATAQGPNGQPMPGYYPPTNYQGQVYKQDMQAGGAYVQPGAPLQVMPPPAGYVPPQGYPPPMQGQPIAYAPPAGYQMYGGTGQMGGYPPPGNMLQGQVSTVAAGTTMSGNLRNSLDSGSTQPGEPVEITLGQPLFGSNGQTLPAGTMLVGQVTNVVSAKRFKFGANGKLDIKFNQCVLPDGRRLPLSASVDTDQIRLTGGTTAGRVGKGAMTTAIGAGSGAVLGTALGAIVGGTAHGPVGASTGMGAVFGTALGGGVGLVGAGVRKGSEIKIPAGTSLPIRVDQPFQVPAPVMGGMPPQYGQPPYVPQYQAPPPQYQQPPMQNQPQPIYYQ